MPEINSNQPELSIIVPVYNEAENIPELYQRLKKSASEVHANHELIFVNDGSKDGSIAVLMKLAETDSCVKYINFSRNFGHQIAVTAGLDFCSGKAVVIIDGDLQDPPELIPELYAKYREGFEVVYARRAERKGEKPLKKFTARIFYRLMRKITNIDIPIDTGDFRIIDEKIVHYLRQMPEQSKFLRGQIAWLGFRQSEVMFSRDQRKHGKTAYTWSKMIRFALDGITGFSDKPLQFVTQLGFLMSIISFAVICYSVYAHFILKETITGWTSLITSSMLIGGVQLISIGIIGTYISRMNKNIANRPLYIIDHSNLRPKKEESTNS